MTPTTIVVLLALGVLVAVTITAVAYLATTHDLIHQNHE